MSVESEKQNDYIIPTNVNSRFELLPGIGFKELKIIAPAVILGIVLYFFLGIFKTTEIIKKEDITVQISIGLTEEELSKDFIELKNDAISAPIRLIIAVFFPAVAYFMLRTDPATNISFYRQLSYQSNYSKSQKRYLYKYNSGSEG